jgi:CRP-like cAMP-binding protein
MDINLILSAQTLHLAPQIKRSQLRNGLIVLKNIETRTYLKVTPEEWVILLRFEKPCMVPSVLGEAIRDRICQPLGETYELVLKAIRAKILLEPGEEPDRVQASDWHSAVRPNVLERPLLLLFCAGLIMAFTFHPRLPTTLNDWVFGIVLLSGALSAGEFLSACMVRGAGGEVYSPGWSWLSIPPRFRAGTDDCAMLTSEEHTTIAMAKPAMLAAAAGITSWDKPGWAFLSLVGLVLSLRPFFGGEISSLVNVGKERAPSDAEHDFLFPPNRQPSARLALLKRAVANPTTWARIAYGVVWTLALLYWGGRLTDIPPWSLEFWRANGIRIAVAVGGSLVILGSGYLSWEIYHLFRAWTTTRRKLLSDWSRRWFGNVEANLDESARMKIISASPLFNALPPPRRLELARSLVVKKHGPWQNLFGDTDTPSHVSFIANGKVSLRRKLESGRTVPLQVLSEGDLIGLHNLADPKYPNYRLRSMTPVTLLMMERSVAEKIVETTITQQTLIDSVLKQPFLHRISLCRNWHSQAISRFAKLSSITDYPKGEVILSEGQSVEDFFVIFEGDARVNRNGKDIATIHAGDFFGEIGLMQNSTPNASVIAHNRTRCLRIPRVELLRFVTHNYTVALEIERVSSKRLGRPLFPLKVADFRSI